MFAVAALWFALAFATPSSETPNSASAASEPKPAAALHHMAVIGASVSAGFRLDGNTDPFSASKLQLADVVAASLQVPNEGLANHATQGFFMNPGAVAKRTLKALAEEKPTAVIALDYLFWFAYGEKPEEKRLPAVEGALAGLATLSCPILLGDLPDMTAASQVPDPVFGRPMLMPVMLPHVETLKKANEAIRAFAKEHANVVLVPLADLTVKLASDAEFSVRGNRYPKGSLDRLMQKDRLHPTLEGTCAVWVAALDAWLAASKDLPASAFECDVQKLLARVAERRQAAAAAAPAPKNGDKPVEVPAGK